MNLEDYHRAMRDQGGKPRPDYEATLAAELRLIGLGGFETQYRFHPERRWRADLAWPEAMVLVEVEGVVRPGAVNPQTGKPIRSRHQTISGYREDCRKYNAAVCLGWRVLRFTQDMVENGEALATIEQALRGDQPTDQREQEER